MVKEPVILMSQNILYFIKISSGSIICYYLPGPTLCCYIVERSFADFYSHLWNIKQEMTHSTTLKQHKTRVCVYVCVVFVCLCESVHV